MQARKDEILAKKAKLAELKRQRELRQKEFSQSRASIGDASEVNLSFSPISFIISSSEKVSVSNCFKFKDHITYP